MLLHAIMILYLFHKTKGLEERPRLLTPGFGNFGDDTLLKCEQINFNRSKGYDWMVNGSSIYYQNPAKYNTRLNNGSFSLIILNTNFSDEGDYACNYNFLPSNTQQLLVEAKGLRQNINFTYIDGNISVNLQRVYPMPRMNVFFENNTEIHGTITDSTKYIDGLYDVVWTSPQVLMAGNYTFRINVTTRSTANYLFKHSIKKEDKINESESSSKLWIIGAVLGPVAFIVIVIVVIWFIRKKVKN